MPSKRRHYYLCIRYKRGLVLYRTLGVKPELSHTGYLIATGLREAKYYKPDTPLFFSVAYRCFTYYIPVFPGGDLSCSLAALCCIVVSLLHCWSICRRVGYTPFAVATAYLLPGIR